MPLDSSELDGDPDIEFAEIDPTGRYGRVRCKFYMYHLSRYI